MYSRCFLHTSIPVIQKSGKSVVTTTVESGADKKEGVMRSSALSDSQSVCAACDAGTVKCSSSGIGLCLKREEIGRPILM